jgi:hypothetical protein
MFVIAVGTVENADSREVPDHVLARLMRSAP